MSGAVEDVPIFPLGTVLFPGGLLPLRVFETRYMDMTRECMKAQKPFGVCLIRSGREVGEAAVPEDIGCLAHIQEWDMHELGVLSLRTRGGQRFRIRDREVTGQGLVRANVDLIDPEPATTLPAVGLTMPMIDFMSVLLPLPLVPSRATVSPSSTRSDSPSSTWTDP